MIPVTDNKQLIEYLNATRLDPKEFEIYLQFKGELYLVESVAKHSETGEEMVVYRNLKTNDVLVRPKDMFMSTKEKYILYPFRIMKINLDDVTINSDETIQKQTIEKL